MPVSKELSTLKGNSSFSFNRVRAPLPMDGTFNQLRPLDRLTGSEIAYEYDLKSATDRWPLTLQTGMLERMFGRLLGKHVIHV